MPSVKEYMILAERDHKLCLLAEKEFPDEYAVSAAAYHIQQAVEKILKGLTLIYGETPEFTHNIAKLSMRLGSLGIKLPDELEDISDTLTLWESTVRYDPFIDLSEKKYSCAKRVYAELWAMLEKELSNISGE